jgi:sialate O-acetylesterase
MKSFLRDLAWLPVLTVLLVGSVSAEVRLPSVIGDNMVLQHGRQVPLWGWAAPHEKVTVAIDGRTRETVAGKDGRWTLQLAAHKPGGPFELTITGQNSITLKNVLFGEVWLCSGQSNMAWGMGNSATAAEIANAHHPTIRAFILHPCATNVPQPTCMGGWRLGDPQNVVDFPAVGYWFALKLQEELKMPIGLINSSSGSTSAEAWTQREALLGDPDFEPMFERAKRAVMAVLEAEYKQATAKWATDANEARQHNKPEPGKPPEPKDIYGGLLAHAPGSMFNGSLHPVIPFGIRGVLWYQGEHNAPRAYQYRKLLPVLIRNWRALWHEGDFPFLIVQLPNIGNVRDEPCENEWAELREAQLMTARSVKHCGLAVTIDIGDAKEIHPRNKWDVGKRLALVALGTVYGKKIEYSGPVLDSAKFRGDKVILDFDHAEGGVVAGAKGEGEPLRGFAVAGDDRKFTFADARIDGNRVILTCPKVVTPVAVRYGWDGNPACNLYNKAGLPASPFRTDDWPGLTINNK